MGGTSSNEQMNLVNQQLDRNQAAYDRYLQQLQSAITGSGYDFMAPKTTTQQSTTRTDQTVTPETTAAYMNLDALARGILEKRLTAGGALPPGYAVTGAQDISRSYDAARTQAANVAAAHGYGGAQATAAATPIAVAQAGDLAKFRANLPLAERQMTTEDLAAEAQRQAQFGTAQHTRGTTSMFGTTITPADIADLLTYWQMLRPYDRPVVNPTAQPGLGGPAIGGAASIGAATILAA